MLRAIDKDSGTVLGRCEVSRKVLGGFQECSKRVLEGRLQARKVLGSRWVEEENSRRF